MSETIVVVDHNPSLARCVRAELPGVTVIENEGRRGLSGARNAGVLVAGGEIIAFLDDDAWAEPDWIERLLAPYEDPAVVGVGGAVEPAWSAGRPSWFPDEFDWVVGCTYRGMPRSTAPVRNPVGCNMSFRREAFEAVGGFRDGIGRLGVLPLGCEETEFCIRLQQHWPDRRILYEPRARVRHAVPESRSSWRYYVARCYAEGLSKALVTGSVGAKDGLASERTYTMRTLPSGMLRGLLATARRHDRTGATRAGAILAGLACTAAGYAAGKLPWARGAAWLAP